MEKNEDTLELITEINNIIIDKNWDKQHIKSFEYMTDFKVVKKAKVELEDEDEFDGIKIAGYLTTFGNVDRQNDIVSPTALDGTLKELLKRGRLPMLKDHTPSTDYQIGSWNKFEKKEKGIYIEGRISKTENTAHLIKLIKDGAINTLSMGGLMKYCAEPNKKGQNIIEEVMLLEVSVVCIPANPEATFSVKSLVQKSEAKVETKLPEENKHKCNCDLVLEFANRKKEIYNKIKEL